MVLTDKDMVEIKNKEISEGVVRKERHLGNTDTNTTTSNTSDAVFFGDGDMFKLLGKFSSKEQGIMKSSKAMEIKGLGCALQITTERVDMQGRVSVAEACTFIPGCHIETKTDPEGKVIGRSLVADSFEDPRCVKQSI